MSLTCICCKTIAHIIVSIIKKHLALDSIHVLADCQHGFRSQRSCETQLVQFVHDIISNLDGAVNCGHKQTYLIIMDFAKAFDKVPHRRLLYLDYYGIRGSTRRRWRNTSSVGEMLDELEWPSLENRRDRSSLLLFYKIHSGAVSIEKDKYLTPAHSLKSTRSSHSA